MFCDETTFGGIRVDNERLAMGFIVYETALLAIPLSLLVGAVEISALIPF